MSAEEATGLSQDAAAQQALIAKLRQVKATGRIVLELPADNAAGLKAIIKGMMKAQHMAETQQAETLKKLVGTYYKTSMENAKIAMGKQPAVVDARSQTQFILDRTDSLVEMGYIKKKPGRDAIDWTLLEAVIKENPDLHGKLKFKSA